MQLSSRPRTRTLLMTVTLLGLAVAGCSTIQSISQALTDVGKLQFKLDRATDFTVNGINISAINSVSDIDPLKAASLVMLVQKKQLPVAFTLNVQARNPNDGSNGKPPTDLYLRRIAWTLLIDNRTTINGIVDRRLQIPSSGQSTIIPITIGLDLFKFFGDKGYEDLMNLAFAIGGRSGSSSRLKLTAKVSAEVPGLGVVDYPGELTIVNTDFTNK